MQVVSSFYTTGFTSTSTTPADSGLTATITPTASTSKILVLIMHTVDISRTSGSVRYGAGVNLLRGATTLLNGNAVFYQEIEGISGYKQLAYIQPITYLDSPATTSATTYKTQGYCWQSGSAMGLNGAFGSTITLMEIGA